MIRKHQQGQKKRSKGKVSLTTSWSSVDLDSTGKMGLTPPTQQKILLPSQKCRFRESNTGPADLQSDALPTELNQLGK